MNVDPEIKKLQDSIQRSKVERAKLQPVGDKLFDGVRLFDQVRERIKSGIRTKNPELDENEIHERFLQLLAAQKTCEEKNVYTIVETCNDNAGDQLH